MPCAASQTSLCYGLLALVLLLASSTDATGQPQACDRNLKPIPGGLGYAWHDEGHRCEGLYQSTVSSVRLQLISVLRGELTFDPDEHQSLNVKAPELPLLADRSVRVRAVALPLKTYYRMDAILPPGRSLRWPLQDIIRRVNLSANEIGVYGWVEGDEGQLFVPLSVAPGDGADTTGGPTRIIVRSAVDLERLVWRTATEGGQVLDQHEYPEAPLRAGRPIVLTLATGPTALLQVDVAGLPSQSDIWTKLTLRVLRPGG